MNIRQIIRSQFLDQLPTRSLQLSNVFRFIASVLVGIGMVRLGVSQYDVGRVEYLLFITFFWSACWHMGLKDSLLSRYFELGESDRKYAFFDYYLLYIGAAVLTGGLMLGLISQTFYFGLDLNGLLDVQYWVVLYAVLLILAAPLDYFFHLSDRHKEVIIFNFLWLIAHVGIIVYGMVMAESLLWMIQGLCALLGVKWGITLWTLFESSDARWSRAALGVVFLFSFPLVLQSLIGVTTQAVDNWLVSYYFNTEIFAVFKFGAKEIPLSVILVTGLVSASIPMYKKSSTSALDHMLAEFRKMVKVLYPIGITLTILSPFLYRWVYGVDYAESATIFNIYILLLLSRLFLPHVILYGHNKNWILVGTVVVEVVLNAVLSILFIHYFGLVGVAYATVVAFMFQKIVFIIYVDRVLGVPSRRYTDWPLYFKYSAVLIGVFIFVQNFLAF